MYQLAVPSRPSLRCPPRNHTVQKTWHKAGREGGPGEGVETDTLEQSHECKEVGDSEGQKTGQEAGERGWLGTCGSREKEKKDEGQSACIGVASSPFCVLFTYFFISSLPLRV